MKRPFGITFMAFVWGLAGIVYMLQGLRMTTSVTFGPLEAGSGVWFWGWIVILTGALFWAAAGAAWTLQAWAWQLGVFLAAWGLFQAFMIIIGYGDWEQAVAMTAWPLLMMWYLHREPVKAAFNIEETPPA